MFCTQCGKQMGQAKFCPTCGCPAETVGREGKASAPQGHVPIMPTVLMKNFSNNREKNEEKTMRTPHIVKPKPRNVEWAIILMWGLLGLSVLSLVLNFSHVSSQGGVAPAVLITAVTYSLTIFVFVKMAAGKNWARWIFLIFFIGGLLMSVGTLPTEWSRSRFSVLLFLMSSGLQICILYLVFTPTASSWFNQAKDPNVLQSEVTVQTTTRSNIPPLPTVDANDRAIKAPPIQRPMPPVDYSDRT